MRTLPLRQPGRNLKSISNKILAFAILATLLPAIGLGVLSFWRYQRVIGDNVAYELRTLADYAGSELILWENARVNDLRTLSTSYTVIDGVAAAASSRAAASRAGALELERYLRSVQKKLEPLLELTVANADGRVLASSSTTPAPVVLPGAWPNSAASEGVIAEPPRWDTARAKPTLTVVVPILSPKQELLGALCAVFDLGTVRQKLAAIAESSLAEVILLAPDGTPLLATRTANSALTPLAPADLQRLQAQPRIPLAFVGLHRREVLGLADVPRTLPIVVVTTVDRGAVYRAWLDLLELFLALVATLVLVVGAAAYGLSRSVVKPLHRLTEGADRVAGGDLSVHLPVTQSDELGHLTRVFNKMTEQLRFGHAEVEAASATLREQNQLLETLSVTDGLTGLYNRKKLESVLAEQFARFRRNRRPFTVLMTDIDNFKAINDTYGHATGDEVLANLAKVLVQSVRNVDYVARYGGEEFVIVLVETAPDAAMEVAERIRLLVQSSRYVSASGPTVAVTASFGVAHSRDDDAGPEAVLARADQALYDAKHAGRNKVVCTA